MSCDETEKKKPSEKPTYYIPGGDCDYEIGEKWIHLGVTEYILKDQKWMFFFTWGLILIISDLCSTLQCYNGGFCVDDENEAKCHCSRGFKGKNCEGKWYWNVL